MLSARTRHYGSAPSPHPLITTRGRYTPYPSRCDALPTSPLSPTFPGCFVTLVRRAVPTSSSQPDAISTTTTPEDEAPIPTVKNSGLIQKPHGEVGRQSSRGYNLEARLQWPDGEAKMMKVTVLSLRIFLS
jgi:hypothetical protein